MHWLRQPAVSTVGCRLQTTTSKLRHELCTAVIQGRHQDGYSHLDGAFADIALGLGRADCSDFEQHRNLRLVSSAGTCGATCMALQQLHASQVASQRVGCQTCGMHASYTCVSSLGCQCKPQYQQRAFLLCAACEVEDTGCSQASTSEANWGRVRCAVTPPSPCHAGGAVWWS
jgi:hypothetical protein